MVLRFMDINKGELAKHRFNQAHQCLISAKTLMDIEDYKGAANRSYYCVFHAIRSILALSKVDFKKHSSVISYFRREYIKTGLMKIELSDIVSELFQVRSESDYDDFYIISKEEVKEQIENAAYFLKEIEGFLNKEISK